MSRPSDAEIIEAGLDLYWNTLGRMRGLRATLGDVCYVQAEGGCGPERIFRVRIREDVDARVARLAADMRSGALPGGALITPNTVPADLADRLAAQGLRIDTDGVCMCLDLAGYAPAPPTGAEIAVVAVMDVDQLAVWSAIVNAALFGGELIRADQFADLLPLPGVHFYLGLYGGTPVTTCMTIHRGDTAVLEMVSTLAAYRRRGVVGAAICRALADLCALGVETISLRAEMDAVSLYRRLGFRDCFPRVVASVP